MPITHKPRLAKAPASKLVPKRIIKSISSNHLPISQKNKIERKIENIAQTTANPISLDLKDDILNIMTKKYLNIFEILKKSKITGEFKFAGKDEGGLMQLK